MSEATTWHCGVCNEDHPLTPEVTTCWVRDQRRISNLEVAVQRIEAEVRAQRGADVVPLTTRWSTCSEPGCDMEAGHEGMHSVERRAEALAQALSARPTPPGVFPPMGYAGLVCAGCRRPGQTLGLSVSGWLTCSDCANATAYTLTSAEPMHPAVGVATVDGKATCPQCPESVESRATYARVPEHAAPAEPSLPSNVERAWDAMRKQQERQDAISGLCRGEPVMCSAPTPAKAAIFERGGYVPGEGYVPGIVAKMAKIARVTDAVRPIGPIAGLDAMLPPLTPAAMLGEAVELQRRVIGLAEALRCSPDVLSAARMVLAWLDRDMREAEVRGWMTCPTHERRMALGEQCPACAEVPR